MRTIEHPMRQARRIQPGAALPQTVNGIGPILALTRLLEAGDMRRLPTVGPFASYGRCLGRALLSSGKYKARGRSGCSSEPLRGLDPDG